MSEMRRRLRELGFAIVFIVSLAANLMSIISILLGLGTDVYFLLIGLLATGCVLMNAGG